ncbi:DUF7507 domain-containing protein, partial [Aquimarina algiphila]|uniref:DUF7507 domain-containing protein n=1 Tax=Aquimarina algiphila TaxID=2047982 RepID=UPI00232ADF72
DGVIIPAGVTSFTVTNGGEEDTIDETDETYTLSVGGTTGTGTIEDNDNAPTIASVTSESETEGTDLVHTVTLSNGSSSVTNFPFSITDVTATVTADYDTPPTFSNGVTLNVAGDGVIIPAGVTSFTVTNGGEEDTIDEADETYTLSVGGTTGTGTIIDNDETSSLSLIKTAITDGFLAGDVITYTFTVRNTGNTIISNIVIDDVLTQSVNLPVVPSTLAPNETGVVTATYAITQADINLGEVINSATVIGQNPSNDDVVDVSDSGDETIDEDGDGDPTNDPTITIIEQLPNLALTKLGVYVDANDDEVPNVGDEIRYTFTVENTGNVDINNIILEDPLPGVVIEGGPIDLSVGQAPDTATFTGVYILTEEDILNGSVTNQATVTGQDINGNDVIDASDDPLNDTDIDLDNDGDAEDETITPIGDIFDLEDDIVIYTGISPNGDSVNDEFRIIGLEDFPKNTLQIFNRWGVKVFERDGYEQPGVSYFVGISEGRTTIREKEELPVGTYYYVLQYENNNGISKSKAGYLYINK